MTDMQPTMQFDYVNEIWGIADYVRDTIKRSEYNRIILPFSLLRRLECALEPTRDAVCEAVQEHEAEWGRESNNYCQTSGKPFYNVTSFRLNNLGAIDTLDALMEYINGFSPNAMEIFTTFRIEETANKLQEGGLLYEVCRRFSTFDLSPENVSDRDILIICEDMLCGYFQYSLTDTTFIMEEIQFKKEYQGCGLFSELYRYLTTIIPIQTKFVEAFSSKENIKSQEILKHLGLTVIGENKNGKSLHFKGEYKALLERYSGE